MSRGIVPTSERWNRSTGIKCPSIILHSLIVTYPQQLLPNNLPLFSDITNVAISKVTDSHIIFKIACINPKIHRQEIGGQYSYDDDWESVLIQRQILSDNLEAQGLYDLVVTNTANWGEAAEIALDFLAETLR